MMMPETAERVSYMWYFGEEHRTPYYPLYRGSDGCRRADVLGPEDNVLQQYGPFNERDQAISAPESYFPVTRVFNDPTC